jgi:hypothetical protein
LLAILIVASAWGFLEAAISSILATLLFNSSVPFFDKYRETEYGPCRSAQTNRCFSLTEEMGNQCSLWRLLRRRSADLVHSAQLRVVAASVSQDWPRMRARTRPRRRSPSTLPLCLALHHNRHSRCKTPSIVLSNVSTTPNRPHYSAGHPALIRPHANSQFCNC